MSDFDIAMFLRATGTEVPSDLVCRIRGSIVEYDTVTQTVTVTLRGGSVSCPGTHFMDFYNPTVGDEVEILSIAGTKIVLGKIRRP